MALIERCLSIKLPIKSIIKVAVIPSQRAPNSLMARWQTLRHFALICAINKQRSHISNHMIICRAERWREREWETADQKKLENNAVPEHVPVCPTKWNENTFEIQNIQIYIIIILVFNRRLTINRDICNSIRVLRKWTMVICCFFFSCFLFCLTFCLLFVVRRFMSSIRCPSLGID